jgi:AraC-like DNA-binding protein
MVMPVLLTSILSMAKACNVPLLSLLRGLEIDATDLATPGVVVSHRDATTVVRRAMRLMPMSGLELGQRARITERGALALGQLSAQTLGDAISLSVRFAQSAGHLLHVREELRADGHHLLGEPFPGDQDLQRFLVELTFCASVQMRRQMTLAKYTPTRVSFVCEAPANVQAYENFFGCAVHFGCLHNALSTHPEWLAFGLPWANVTANRLSLQLLAQEAERFQSMSALGFSVERAIRRRLPEVVELAQVAASLNLSERTLRRQLAHVGLSYRHLLDESRKSRAFDLMTAGHRSIADIAAATGFADPRAFTRAFKRWTGRPPSQVRADAAETGQAPLAGQD